VTSRGIYVHVPYCLAKCRYCDFNSYPVRGGVPGSYIEALVTDIEAEGLLWREDRPVPGDAVPGDEGFATIYLGGGTPSLLSPEQARTIVGALRSSFAVAADAEITMECNPATVDLPKLEAFRACGINRLSVGVQSLDPRELAFLGRLHGPGEALEALAWARRAGFEDLSADLMLGIPGQTHRSFEASLDGVLTGLTHVSVYMLTAERGTPLAEMVAGGLAVLPDEITAARQYERAARLLAARGFRRYEISNWCLEGHRCRHNDIYWRRGEYVGVGAGAHSHRGGSRSAKIADPGRYARALNAGGNAVEFQETLTGRQVMLEEIMLGLRTDSGLKPSLLARGRGAWRSVLDARLADLVAGGLLVKGRNNLTLSPKGVLLHEAVCGFLADGLTGANT
jgi:oxygen-independent coproporphyrinogen-3 oxidase